MILYDRDRNSGQNKISLLPFQEGSDFRVLRLAGLIEWKNEKFPFLKLKQIKSNKLIFSGGG